MIFIENNEIKTNYTKLATAIRSSRGTLVELRKSADELLELDDIFSKRSFLVKFLECIKGMVSGAAGFLSSILTFGVAGKIKTGEFKFFHDATALTAILKAVGLGTMVGGLAALVIVGTLVTAKCYSTFNKLEKNFKVKLERSARDSLRAISVSCSFISKSDLDKPLSTCADIAVVDECCHATFNILTAGKTLETNILLSPEFNDGIKDMKEACNTLQGGLLCDLKDNMIDDPNLIHDLYQIKLENSITHLGPKGDMELTLLERFHVVRRLNRMEDSV